LGRFVAFATPARANSRTGYCLRLAQSERCGIRRRKRRSHAEGFFRRPKSPLSKFGFYPHLVRGLDAPFGLGSAPVAIVPAPQNFSGFKKRNLFFRRSGFVGNSPGLPASFPARVPACRWCHFAQRCGVAAFSGCQCRGVFG